MLLLGRIVLRPSFVPNDLVELGRPWFLDHSARGFFHHFSRCFANGHHIVPPIVDEKGRWVFVGQCVTVHFANLSFRHRCVCSQSGQDLDPGRSSGLLVFAFYLGHFDGWFFTIAGSGCTLVVLRNYLCDETSLRWKSGKVGRQQQDVFPVAQGVEEGI